MEKYKLTNRQKEVVELRGKGLSFREIAEQFNITDNTARHHYETALRKLENEKLIQEFLNGSTIDVLMKKYNHPESIVLGLVQPYQAQKLLNKQTVNINTREAFKVFIRHELNILVKNGIRDLTVKEIEYVANQLENDFEYHKAFGEFLSEFIEDKVNRVKKDLKC